MKDAALARGARQQLFLLQVVRAEAQVAQWQCSSKLAVGFPHSVSTTMPSNIRGDPIHRFTYDWLIRFAELHPLEKAYFKLKDYLSYDPEASEYSHISPTFSHLMEKHMPYIERCFGTEIINGVIGDEDLPQTTKIIVMIGRIFFSDFVPGTFIRCYTKNRIHLNEMRFVMQRSTISPTEFKLLLKRAEKAQFFECSLTEPVACSEVWPLLRRCEMIDFDIKNLVFDNKMPEMLAKIDWRVMNELITLYGFDLLEKSVLPVLDHFIADSYIKWYELKFKPEYSDASIDAMVQIVEEKLKALGYIVDKAVGLPFCRCTISFRKKEANNTISLRFRYC